MGQVFNFKNIFLSSFIFKKDKRRVNIYIKHPHWIKYHIVHIELILVLAYTQNIIHIRKFFFSLLERIKESFSVQVQIFFLLFVWLLIPQNELYRIPSR